MVLLAPHCGLVALLHAAATELPALLAREELFEELPWEDERRAEEEEAGALEEAGLLEEDLEEETRLEDFEDDLLEDLALEDLLDGGHFGGVVQRYTLWRPLFTRGLPVSRI